MSKIVELGRAENGVLQIHFRCSPEEMTAMERRECAERLSAEHAQRVRDAGTLHQTLEYLADLNCAAERK